MLLPLVRENYSLPSVLALSILDLRPVEEALHMRVVRRAPLPRHGPCYVVFFACSNSSYPVVVAPRDCYALGMPSLPKLGVR